MGGGNETPRTLPGPLPLDLPRQQGFGAKPHPLPQGHWEEPRRQRRHGAPRLKPENAIQGFSPTAVSGPAAATVGTTHSTVHMTSAPSCHPALTQTHTHTRELCSPQHTYPALRASLASRTPGYNPKPCRSPPHLSSHAPLLQHTATPLIPVTSSVLAESIAHLSCPSGNTTLYLVAFRSQIRRTTTKKMLQ